MFPGQEHRFENGKYGVDRALLGQIPNLPGDFLPAVLSDVPAVQQNRTFGFEQAGNAFEERGLARSVRDTLNKLG